MSNTENKVSNLKSALLLGAGAVAGFALARIFGRGRASKAATRYPRKLFPPVEPYNTGFLTPAGSIHKIYYEECGNPQGKPVLFLHGGPGGGLILKYRQYFDPKKWRIILMDQRGSGKSTPVASLVDNTTWHLVDDIELLRKTCQVDRWVVFGGSWGSTLALAYAEKHPEIVKALVLRGIFTLRRSELDFFYQEGTSWYFPEQFEKFLAPIPEEERDNLMKAYYKRLTGDDEKAKVECAKAWSLWEKSTSKLEVDPASLTSTDEKWCVQFARIECHFFNNAGWMRDGQLIEEANKLKDIPGVIVTGRYDSVCPMKSSYDLHKSWEGSELIVVPDAGHSISEEGITHHLIEAAEKFVLL